MTISVDTRRARDYDSRLDFGTSMKRLHHDLPQTESAFANFRERDGMRPSVEIVPQ